jgi:hypothetical protein
MRNFCAIEVVMDFFTTQKKCVGNSEAIQDSFHINLFSHALTFFLFV